MLIKWIVNIQDWAESERKFQKWEHEVIIRGHQKERSMFVCMFTNGLYGDVGLNLNEAGISERLEVSR